MKGGYDEWLYRYKNIPTPSISSMIWMCTRNIRNTVCGGVYYLLKMGIPYTFREYFDNLESDVTPIVLVDHVNSSDLKISWRSSGRRGSHTFNFNIEKGFIRIGIDDVIQTINNSIIRNQ